LTTAHFPATEADTDPFTGAFQEQSLDGIVRDYMPLVRHAVSRLVSGASHNPVLQYEDMVSCGVEGLLEAHRAFDPGRGVKFSTYALPRIRGSILDALRAAHPLPRSVQKMSSDIEKALAALYTELGRTPTKLELANRLKLSLDQLLEAARTTSIRVFSLENLAELSLRGASEKLNELADDDPGIDPGAVAERTLMRRALIKAIHCLPARERAIIRLYYIESRSLKSIGRALAISESRTSQLRHRAIRRLRTALTGGLDAAA
jgi:RNA polymerase sigma factor for flagellar operon FliA